jgi:predicted CXXCH cytochrome family protein
MKSESKHMTWAWLLTAILFFALGTQSALAAIGSIVGSKHDFSANSGSPFAGTSIQVCVYCHAPHAATTQTPLWNHTSSAASYTMYTSPTLNALMGSAPGNVSKLCLSCHDGTVAIDSFGAVGNPTSLNKFGPTSPQNLGTNLGNDHPIGFPYDATLVAADPGLRDPSTTSVTIGTGNAGTIATKMLIAGQVECASCHDVHNSTSGTAVQAKLLRITSDGSAICIACHKK